MDSNDAIQFWQREAYYYEARAGEQGASANRMVTVAAGATAIIPLVANTIGAPPAVRLLLLVVPVILLLLWTSAIRLLHEMHLLRVYVRRAEQELEKLTAEQPALSGYTRWAAHGGKHDMAYYVMLVWFFTALTLSLAGTLGIAIAVVSDASPTKVPLAVGVLAIAVIVLTISAADTSNDVRYLEKALKLTDAAADRSKPARSVVLVGLLSGFALAVAGPVAIVCVRAEPVSLILWVLVVYLGLIAVLGGVVGVLADDAPGDSVEKRSSKVLVAAALIGGIAAVVVSLAGGYGP